MRVLIATATRRVVGGAERYVEAAIAALTAAGHGVALLAEFEGPASRPLPEGRVDRSWTIAVQPDACANAAGWRPDVVFSQGLTSPAHERQLLGMAPTVLAAHGYRGQCISGSKTLARRNMACGRQLAPPCLLHYFPDRCGGRNPVSMIASWGRERGHQQLFAQYAAVVTLSEHMRRECIAHGASAFTTMAVPPAGPRRLAPADVLIPPAPDLTAQWRLLFVGRLEPLKGGDLLIDAASHLARHGAPPVHVTFIGDGAMRQAWEARAARAAHGAPALTVGFEGWLDESQQQPWLAASHLLVVPSVWPEPYGLVGIEAARHGVPAVGFPLGGIPEWLIDGVTGRLAALPPTAASLATAIADVLGRPESYAHMKAQAASAWAPDATPHFARVIAVLEAAAAASPARSERAKDYAPA